MNSKKPLNLSILFLDYSINNSTNFLLKFSFFKSFSKTSTINFTFNSNSLNIFFWRAIKKLNFIAARERDVYFVLFKQTHDSRLLHIFFSIPLFLNIFIFFSSFPSIHSFFLHFVGVEMKVKSDCNISFFFRIKLVRNWQ